MSDVTRILSAIEQGNRKASEQLLPLVYDELRKLATAMMAQENPGQTLQATALVHEAYLRLVGNVCFEPWPSGRPLPPDLLCPALCGMGEQRNVGIRLAGFVMVTRFSIIRHCITFRFVGVRWCLTPGGIQPHGYRFLSRQDIRCQSNR